MDLSNNYFGTSHVGRVRTENQDCYGVFISPGNYSIYAICDGMGGAKGGKVASSLAVKSLSENLDSIAKVHDFDTAVSVINNIFDQANQAVFKLSHEDPHLSGMGTTMIVLFFFKFGAFVAHVGDSRLYLVKDNNISILTKDHTFAQELVDAGAITVSNANKSPVSHLLTKAVGIQKKVEVEVSKIDNLEKSDLFILGSDGLHNHLKEDKILELSNKFLTKDAIGSKWNLEKITKTLVDEALNQGGTDNVSVISVSPIYPMGIKPSDDNLSPEVSFIYDEENDPARFFNPTIYSASNAKVNTLPMLLWLILGLVLFSFIIRTIWISSGVFGVASNKQVSSSNFITKLGKDTYQKNNKSNGSSESLSIFEQFIALEDILGDKEQIVSLVQRKNKELLSVSAEPIADSEEYELLLFPDQPIDWSEDEKVIKSLHSPEKNAGVDTKNNNENKNLLGLDESLEIIKNKSDLRERIADIDQKLVSLTIDTEEEISKTKETLKQESSDILNEINLLAKAKHIAEETRISFSEKFKDVTGEDLLRLASLYTSIDPSLEPLRKKILEANRQIEFYKKLLSQSSAQIGVATILSSVSRDKSDLEEELKQKISSLSVKNTSEISEYITNIDWLSSLLLLESQRYNRNISFIGAYQSLTKDRKIGVFKALAEKREELFSEYSNLNKQVSLEREFELQTKNQ